MGMMKRLGEAIGAAAQAILTSAEDPSHHADNAYDRLADLLQQVKVARKQMAQGRRRLESGAKRLEARIAQLEVEARAHLAASRETEARGALHSRLRVAMELNALRDRIAGVHDEEQSLTQAAQQLTARLDALVGQRELAQARTEAQARIDEALERVAIGPDGLDLTFEDVRRRSELFAADWSAIDSLVGVLEATSGPPLERQLLDLDADDEIERQLSAMKAQTLVAGPDGPATASDLSVEKGD